MRTLIPALILFATAAMNSAFGTITVTNSTNLILSGPVLTLPGSNNGAGQIADVTGGNGGTLIPYTETGSNTYSGVGGGRTGTYGAQRLNDGDVGIGVGTSTFHAIPTFGTDSVVMTFTGGSKTITSIAIYHGYDDRDGANYVLKDAAGNTIGAWTCVDNDSLTEHFWLNFPTPVTTTGLRIETSANASTGGFATPSFREIQVFSNVGNISANYTSASATPLTSAGFTASGRTVNFTLNYAPTPGTSLKVIENTGINFIQGTFSNLANGQPVALTYLGQTYPFVAWYYGGTGNDLVLLWQNTGLASWGRNAFGQIGDGTFSTTISKLVPVETDQGGIYSEKTLVQVVRGASHTVALYTDGTVAAWGLNQNGRIGINVSDNSRYTVPQLVDTTSGSALAGKFVVALAAGDYHTLALCSDGTVVGWGGNSQGQLGTNNFNDAIRPVAVNTTSGTSALFGKTVVAIAAGGQHSVALCSDNTLAGWGTNTLGEVGDNTFTRRTTPRAVVNTGALAGKTIIAIEAGTNNSMALSSTGLVVTWGQSTTLGNNSGIESPVPVNVDTSGALSGKTVVSIKTGGGHCVALCSDDTLVAWGTNDNGQLGDNSVSYRPVPTLVNRASGTSSLFGKTIRSISTGWRHTFALATDGSVSSWGTNQWGQLGNNSTSQSNVPTLANTTDGVSALFNRPVSGLSGSSSGAEHSIAVYVAPPGVQISAIANFSTNEDTSTGNVPFTVGTVGTLTATSSNTTLVPNGNIALGGSGSTRTINITPALDQNGSTTITINDSLSGGSRSFVLTVNPLNDAPRFTKGANQVALGNDTGPRTIPGWATGIDSGPPDETGQGLTFVVTNSNNALFTSNPTVRTSTGNLEYQPNFANPGTVTVTVSLRDNGSDINGNVNISAPQTFTITIVPAINAPLAPASGSSNVGMRPQLSWTAFTAPGLTYELFLGTSAGNLSSQGIVTSPFTPTISSFNTTYFWRVDSLFGGQRATGSVFSFTTRPKNFIVNTNVDENNGFATGGISLREAVSDVITASPPETITFAGGLSGQSIILNNGQITIRSSVDISAAALSGGMTIDANNASRVFDVLSGAVVSMDTLTITKGNTGNSGASGGGIRNSGVLNLRNSTLADNHCDEAGAYGGAIYSGVGAQLGLTNCTVANNSGYRGGGIANNGGSTVALNHVTISGNTAGLEQGGISSAGNFSISNSILAGNTASNADTDFKKSSPPIRTGVNFIGDISGSSLTASATLLTGSPRLAALADNGGPTKTMMLLAGSPAIDAGGTATLTTDQRGFERVLGAGPDLGAYEAAAGSFNLAGLTVYAKLASALTGSGVNFEISTDPNFEAGTSTLSGTGTAGFLDGPKTAAKFSYPSGVTEDSSGNIFVADTGNNRIRIITPDGVVSTIAGSGTYGFADGPGASAMFAFPTAIVVGPNQHLYVSDTFNHRIRKLTRPSSAGQPWTASTFAGDGSPAFLDATGAAARFNRPYDLVLDGANLLVADSSNKRIREITPAGVVTTRYYNGGFLGNPTGLTRDTSGNLFVASAATHVIWKINSGTTTANLFAGGSQGNVSSSNFNRPVSLAIDTTNNLYVADEDNHAIRKITPAGVVSTIAGNGSIGNSNGAGSAARFKKPQGVFVNRNGQLLVADTENHLIRQVMIKPLTVAAVVAAGGENISAVIDAETLGLAPDTTYYVRWRSLAAGMQVQTHGQSFYLPGTPSVVTVEAGNLLPTSATLNGTVNPNNSPTEAKFEYSTDPELAGPWQVSTVVPSGFTKPQGIASFGTNTYVSDETKNAIFRVDATGVKNNFVGATNNASGLTNGSGTTARFDHPAGLATDAAGNIYVADEFNHCIRIITPGGAVDTFAGTGSAGFTNGSALTTARFLFPRGVAVFGTDVYVADTGNHCIRKISGGVVSTVAGTGVEGFANGPAATAQFKSPQDLAVDVSGIIHVADTGNHRIRLINSGSVLTLAGTGIDSHLDGSGSTARFSSPTGIAIEQSPGGKIYVCDRGSHRLRSIDSSGQVNTVAGSGAAGALNTVVGQLYPATSASFNQPTGITLNPSGQIMLSDAGNSVLRRISRGDLPDFVVDPEKLISGPISGSPTETLLRGATYYFRAVATNGRGRAEGTILSFTTPQSDIVVRLGTSVTAPTIQSGASIDFGSTPLSTDLIRSITIENIGSSALNISSITASGGFVSSVSSLAAIPAASSRTFTVKLNNATANTFSGVLTINSDDLDSGTITFPLTGKTLAPASLSAVAASNVTAIGVTFSATVNPQGSPTDLVFEYSKYSNFTGILEVLTTAGSDQGFSAGCGPEASFDTPSDIAVDQFGNIYVADTGNNRIREIATNGDCTVLAGTGSTGSDNGPGASATFNSPKGVAVDLLGNVYVADTNNHRIRRIATDGQVTTLAGFGSSGAFTDGVLSAARFNQPSGIAVDSAGNLYIADTGNNRIRMISNAGEVTTLASSFSFNAPANLTIDAVGTLYVTDKGGTSSNRVIKFKISQTPTVVASSGFNNPNGISVDAIGNIFVADQGNHRIARIDSITQAVTTIAGASGSVGTVDGTGSTARFNQPTGIAVSPAGTIYVADRGNHRIRQIALAARTVTAATALTAAGNNNITLDLAGLEPNTTYYYRSIATNGGGSTTVLPLNPTPGLTFKTLDNIAELSALTVNGVAVPGFNPCVFSYPVALASQATAATVRATAASSNAELKLFLNDVHCCDLTSGVASPPQTLIPGDNVLRVDVISDDETALHSYSMTIASTVTGSPFTQWQSANFGANASNPLIAGINADPSKDGVVNLLKYALFLDPNISTRVGLPTLGDNGDDITLTYIKNTAATDLTYQVQWSTNMQDWFTSGITETLVDDLTTRRVIRASVARGSDTKKFLRLVVTLP